MIEAVRNLAGDDAAPSVLHLISDLQNSAMPSRFQDLVLPESSELVLHDVAAGDFANWAIDSVKGSTRVYGRDAPKLEAGGCQFCRERGQQDGFAVDRRSLGRQPAEEHRR